MKTNKTLIRVAAECLVAVWLLAACLCSSDLAGASQVGSPSSVVGYVNTTQQKPATGVKVYLLSAQFVPGVETADTSGDTGALTGIIKIGGDTTQFITVTDSNGRFTINKVPQNTYNLFISDSAVSEVALRRNVSVNQSRVDLGTETLKKPGTVLFNIADTMFYTNGYLAVKGTPLVQKVSSPGQYSLNVPDDSVSIVYHTPTVSVPMYADSSRSVYVNSGDTVDMTGIPAVVINGSLGYRSSGPILPLSPADSIYTMDSTVQFVVSGAYSNKGAALEYQFYVSTDTLPPVLTNWSVSNSYLFHMKVTGWYYVSYRVRGQTADGTIVSEWGPTCAVMIKRSGGGIVMVTAPRTPALIDSMVLPDTVRFWFSTGSSVSTFGGEVQYRFQWMSDSSGFHITPWSPDSITTITFVPAPNSINISSQARSSIDTAVYSSWSDSVSLYFR